MNWIQMKRSWPKRLNYTIAIVLFLFGQHVLAQTERYELQKYIETGLEQNFSLQVIKNRGTVAENNYTPGNAGMLPIITSTNRFGGTVNSTTQNATDGTETVTNGIHNTTGSAALNLGMTLFRGFQVRYTYNKLGKQVELSGLNSQMAIENLVAQLVAEYNNFIQQQILYNNLRYAVSLSRERVRIDEQRYNLGSASKVEWLQSRVYLNADSSRYARQKEVLRSSQIKLNELMAISDIGREIVPVDTLIQIDENLSYDALLAQTLELNTSLQIARKNQEITDLDAKIIESRSYPYLNLNTGYGYNYYGYEASALRNQHVRGFNYGLTLGVDLYDGNNKRRERTNARIETENRQLQLREVEQQVKADLLSLFYAYENNLRLLRLEEQNLNVARENLEIALERYKLGSLAGLELREVQKSLLDAEERLNSVRYQTKVAEISLLQISGRVMEYAK